MASCNHRGGQPRNPKIFSPPTCGNGPRQARPTWRRRPAHSHRVSRLVARRPRTSTSGAGGQLLGRTGSRRTRCRTGVTAGHAAGQERRRCGARTAGELGEPELFVAVGAVVAAPTTYVMVSSGPKAAARASSSSSIPAGLDGLTVSRRRSGRRSGWAEVEAGQDVLAIGREHGALDPGRMARSRAAAAASDLHGAGRGALDADGGGDVERYSASGTSTGSKSGSCQDQDSPSSL